MELLSLFHVLARHRIAVGLGVLASLVVGLAAIGGLPFGPSASGGQTAGAAHTRLLIDLRYSLIDDLHSSSDTIGTQAAMLVDLMAAEPQVRAIARGAHVPASQILVLRPALTSPTRPSPLADDASVAAATPTAYTLTVSAAVALPIVTIDARAPDARTAARLVQAAAGAMQSLAASRAPSARRALVVRPLEPVRAAVVVSTGRRKIMALVLSVLIFTLWCGGIVIASGVKRAFRRDAVRAAGAG
jgi:hypothetical protein